MKPKRARIAILRAPDRAEALRQALVCRGYDVVIRPVTCIRYLAPPDDEDWAALVRESDCVVLTSRNGVEGLARRIGGPHALAALLNNRRVAAMGGASRKCLRAAGVGTVRGGQCGTSAELAAALLAELPTASNVLYPCGRAALRDLPEALRNARHRVRCLVCYETAAIPVEQRETLDWTELEAAVVAAPSAVAAVAQEMTVPSALPFVALGPTTAAALRMRGMTLAGVAATPDVNGVVSILEQWVVHGRERIRARA